MAGATPDFNALDRLIRRRSSAARTPVLTNLAGRARNALPWTSAPKERERYGEQMTTTNEEIAPSKRLISLDAVGGIAACIVVLSHCYRIIPEEQRSRIDDSLWSQPLLPLHNGDAAVFIFFVSSGYVLSLPYLRGTQPGYPYYVIRRVCRIYIPFAAAILFALLLYIFAGRPDAPAVSQWFNNLWPSTKPGIAVVAKHLLMLGTAPNMKLNAVMWTLVYELRISLLFPLLMILCRNSSVLLALCCSKHRPRLSPYWASSDIPRMPKISLLHCSGRLK
jgi:peptidoglycan/LPS O-acetylase OafA/YrhL